MIRVRPLPADCSDSLSRPFLLSSCFMNSTELCKLDQLLGFLRRTTAEIFFAFGPIARACMRAWKVHRHSSAVAFFCAFPKYRRRSKSTVSEVRVSSLLKFRHGTVVVHLPFFISFSLLLSSLSRSLPRSLSHTSYKVCKNWSFPSISFCQLPEHTCTYGLKIMSLL
jgi:hypothetical protein